MISEDVVISAGALSAAPYAPDTRCGASLPRESSLLAVTCAVWVSLAWSNPMATCDAPGGAGRHLRGHDVLYGGRGRVRRAGGHPVRQPEVRLYGLRRSAGYAARFECVTPTVTSVTVASVLCSVATCAYGSFV
jgi:hypothetical protein